MRPNPDIWRSILLGTLRHYCAQGSAVSPIGTPGAPLTAADVAAAPENATIATNDSTADSRITPEILGSRWLVIVRTTTPRIIQGERAT